MARLGCPPIRTIFCSTKPPPAPKIFAHPKMSHIIWVEGNLQDVGDTKQRLKYYSRLDAGPGSENRRLDNFFSSYFFVDFI